MDILMIRNSSGMFQPVPAIKGSKGDKGDKGDTPVRGIDYYTDDDKAEIIRDILATFPKAESEEF